jgi:hypothetical protein
MMCFPSRHCPNPSLRTKPDDGREAVRLEDHDWLLKRSLAPLVGAQLTNQVNNRHVSNSILTPTCGAQHHATSVKIEREKRPTDLSGLLVVLGTKGAVLGLSPALLLSVLEKKKEEKHAGQVMAQPRPSTQVTTRFRLELSFRETTTAGKGPKAR